MRRPLFTTGIPQELPVLAPGNIVVTPDAALSVMDMRSLDTELQSVTRFVTLYALNQYAPESIVSLAWREGTSTALEISAVEVTGADPIGAQPVKILDRFPLRGNAQLLASTNEYAFLYGYFETEIRFDAPAGRPLANEALVTPFTYEPGFVIEADPGPLEVHALSDAYIDLVTLDLSIRGTTTPAATLTITDGTDSVTIEFEPQVENIRVFDGIPMIGATAAGSISIEASVDAPDDQCAAWGSFLRLT